MHATYIYEKRLGENISHVLPVPRAWPQTLSGGGVNSRPINNVRGEVIGEWVVYREYRGK